MPEERPARKWAGNQTNSEHMWPLLLLEGCELAASWSRICQTVDIAQQGRRCRSPSQHPLHVAHSPLDAPRELLASLSTALPRTKETGISTRYTFLHEQVLSLAPASSQARMAGTLCNSTTGFAASATFPSLSKLLLPRDSRRTKPGLAATNRDHTQRVSYRFANSASRVVDFRESRTSRSDSTFQTVAFGLCNSPPSRLFSGSESRGSRVQRLITSDAMCMLEPT